MRLSFETSIHGLKILGLLASGFLRGIATSRGSFDCVALSGLAVVWRRVAGRIPKALLSKPGRCPGLVCFAPSGRGLQMHDVV